MKLTTREKLIRTIVSSILLSDLTNNEIRSISSSLNRNEDILWDLREILRDVTNKLDIYSSTFSKSYDTSSPVKERIRMAMDIIKRKRISKIKIISYMESMSPSDLILHEANRVPVKTLIEKYFNSKSENAQSKLINLLETSGKGGDEYLKGIMDRR